MLPHHTPISIETDPWSTLLCLPANPWQNLLPIEEHTLHLKPPLCKAIALALALASSNHHCVWPAPIPYLGSGQRAWLLNPRGVASAAITHLSILLHSSMNSREAIVLPSFVAVAIHPRPV
ncbi:unnamed protein product [Camellia sinensis]